jgi:serine/threonine-protein kinase
MPRLIVEKGTDKGRSIPVPARSTSVFGRDTSANVQIKDTMASRMHFKVEPRADGLWIVDLESMNGTLLNGHPLREAKLNPGDLIRVGETMYSFLADDKGEDPLLNQRLGGYKILERVGRGGMGTVYKAEQVDLQRIVALKIISEEHLKNQEFIDLFVHEARAAAKLNHPNIVQVYDVKKSNELYYFSMEFVPGGSVQDLLNRQRKLAVDETVRMILEAARGLEYAHRKEIIHRDIKPDNFMLGEGGAIKIGDLGLAQRLGEKLSADDENTVIGTPHYIAPEQVLGRPADCRSDIYSLGSTMYRMIAGFTPFQAPSVRELVNRKAREEATPLHVAVADVPEPLSKICARMMARQPEQRHVSMTEVIADLETWTRGSSGVEDMPKEAAPVNRRLLAAAVSLLAVVTLGGIVGAMVMWKKDPGTPVTTPTSNPPDPAGAEVKLDLAHIAETKIVEGSPESHEEVIKLYQGVADRWPGTPWADKASARVLALQAKLRGLRAARQLAALDEADREAWKRLVQSFQGGNEDLSEADKMIAAYRGFAAEEASKGTDAAADATRRAGGIAAWKAEVEKRRSAFEAVRNEVDRCKAQHRYRDAWEACAKFLSDATGYKSEWKDRYDSLLYDALGRREQERVVEGANARYSEVEKISSGHEASGEFAKALEALEATVRDSLADPAQRAKQRQEEIHTRWSEATKRAAQKEAEDRREKEELDLRDYEARGRRWRDRILNFDPKGALADALKIQGGADKFPRLPASADRLKERILALRILADFKETFLRVWNDPKQGMSRRIALGSISGSILKATEDRFVIGLGSGQADKLYRELLAGAGAQDDFPLFLAWLKGAWKGADAKWAMGLAVLCLEVGHFERGLEEIKGLERSTDEEVRKFVAEFKPLAAELDFLDAPEIEAQKHLERLQAAKKDLDGGGSPRFDPDRALQVLRNRYPATAVVTANKAAIEDIEKKLIERGGKARDKKLREEKYQKIQALRAKVETEARAKEEEITKSIGNIRDLLERHYHLGESQLAFGDMKSSTAALSDGLDLGLKRMAAAPRRNPMDPVPNLVARIAGGLMRNYTLLRQEAKAAQIRSTVKLRFTDPTGEYEGWTLVETGFDRWVREVLALLKQHGDGLRKLEEALQENPEPKALWELAEAREKIKEYRDARGLYVAVLENPEFEHVKNGDALLRLAEVTFMFRDILEAEKLFQRMRLEYPNHVKVTSREGFDTVDFRLRQCSDLKNKMQLPSK